MQTGRPAALGGTVVVAFLIVGSRWGAHLGASPLYLTDLLATAALFHAFWRHRLGVGQALEGASKDTGPGRILLAFFAWSMFRALIGLPLDANAFRDLAPYAYSGLAIIAAHAYARSTSATRARTSRLLIGALVAHAAWVAASAHGLTSGLPVVDGVELLSLRNDFDGAMLGVLAGWCAWRILARTAVTRTWLALGLVTVAFLGLNSRAALLGAALAVALGVRAGVRASRRRRRILNVAFVILFGSVLLLALPFTRPGARLLATIDPAAATSEDTQAARGTADARARAWSVLTDWITDDIARSTFGVGFGPNFVHDSGTDKALLGNTDHDEVRSPHNYLLATWARLGLIGAGLWVLLVAELYRAIRRTMPLFTTEPLLLLCSMTVAALVPAGLLGVIFESPFGAIPFYWCAGILLAQPVTEARATGPRSRSTRA